jgi:hypothetical protein
MATRLLVRDLVGGAELGHSQVVKKIGTSATGEVYRARDVAIRVSETHHICGVRQGPRANGDGENRSCFRTGAGGSNRPSSATDHSTSLPNRSESADPQMRLLMQRSRSPFHVLADYARV